VKSIDAKKIAAITFGAALLGASILAAAPVTVDNIDVISAQGQPTVQIVVGKNAAASDGVAAANIAAVVGSLSYASKKVSAKLVGSPTCSATATAGTGACTITSGSEQVALDVYTPGGTIAGAYAIKTYMYGFIDSDTTDDQVGGGTKRVVDSNYWTAFADTTARDSTASKTYTVKYKINTGTIRAAEFDTTYNKFKTYLSTLDYITTFDETSYSGIPACTKSDVISNTSETSAANAMLHCADTYKTSGHRVSIKFLGEDWIISNMDPTVASPSIKLAKESVAEQRLYVGQNVSTAKYVLKLETVSIPYGTVAATASIKIFDAATGAYTGQTASVSAAETKDVTIGSDTLSIHVYEVLAGLTPLDSWARTAVYTQEITLTNNQVVDTDDNNKWKVYLTWGNYSSGQNIILKSINLSRIGMPVAMMEGDSVNIIGKPAMYQMYFAGQSLGTSNLEKLTVTYESSISYSDEKSGDYINTITGKDVVCLASETKSAFKLPDGAEKKKVCFGKVPVLYEKTAGSSDYYALETQGSSATVVVDGTTRNVTYWNGATLTLLPTANISMKELYAPSAGTGDYPGIVYGFVLGTSVANTTLYKVTASNDSTIPIGSYATNNQTNGTVVLKTTDLSSTGKFNANATVTWKYRINDESQYDKNVTWAGTAAIPTLMITEVADKLLAKDINWSLQADFTTDKAIEANVSAATTTTDEVTYGGRAVEDGTVASATTVKANYVNQKGSKLVSKSKTQAVFDMAKKLGELEYDLKPSSATATAGGTTTYNKGVNGTLTVGDSTITVKSVSATTTPCSVTGGAVTCTAAVTAAPTLDGEEVTADTTVSVPWVYSSAKKLVVLDSETPTADVLILVGGPSVNTMTAEELKAQPGIKLDAAGKKVAGKITDKKILVAGYTAADTTSAATDLIKKLLGE
jgi:hypothetical protein